MLWFLLWVVLVLAAVGVLGLLMLRLWRQAAALGREMSSATAKLEQVASQLETLQERDASPPSR